MRKTRKIPSPFILIAVSSIIAGSLLFFFIIGQAPAVNFGGDSSVQFLANATFRDERLVIHIRNLTGDEVEVSTVYLVGQNFMDYEMLVNEVIKPEEELEIETNISQPEQKGTYTVRISLSNGLTVECEVNVDPFK